MACNAVIKIEMEVFQTFCLQSSSVSRSSETVISRTSAGFAGRTFSNSVLRTSLERRVFWPIHGAQKCKLAGTANGFFL